MVRNNIKVFARVKREQRKQILTHYEISTKKEHDYLIIRNQIYTEECPKTTYKFRFLNVFDQDSSQLEVFETVAKPIVNSVLNGFNGTVFAYGQTGSGKTYSITGSSKEYNQRGIIPRSVELIFENAEKNPHKYTLYISYLEIYNESGYDLLSTRQTAPGQAEELPRVVLLADGKGEYHLRNLSLHPVATVQEAMGLLFLGDANRTIVETPLNDSSSRSHCVFTVYMSSLGEEGVIRRSKLHLVDLAGSERVYKSRVTGQTLTEAKYINLSLHYLEQVIVALSETNRPHVPFRNSMMTYMLKDSLAGNCLTAMLTTVSVNVRDIEETISTCKFAQRVSMVNTEPRMNEEVDMQQQLDFLQRENSELRKQLCSLRSVPYQELKNGEPVDEQYCKQEVQKFLNNTITGESMGVHNHKEIEHCFALMKQMYLKERNDRRKSKSAEITSRDMLNKYKSLINQKDDELLILNDLVDTLSRGSTFSLGLQKMPDKFDDPLPQDQLFQAFASDPKNRAEIDYYSNEIQTEYSAAKELSQVIEGCRKDIKQLKHKLSNEAGRYDEKTKVEMHTSLMRLVSFYLQTLIKIKNIKLTTDDLKHGLEDAQVTLLKKFRNCMEKKQQTFKNTSYRHNHSIQKDGMDAPDTQNFSNAVTISTLIAYPSNGRSVGSLESYCQQNLVDVSPTKDSTPDLSRISSHSTLVDSESCLYCAKDNQKVLHQKEKGHEHNSVDLSENPAPKVISFGGCETVETDKYATPRPLIVDRDEASVSEIEKEMCCENLSNCATNESSSQILNEHPDCSKIKNASRVIVENNPTVGSVSVRVNGYNGGASEGQPPPKQCRKGPMHVKKDRVRKARAMHTVKEVDQDNPIQDLIELESERTQVSDEDFAQVAARTKGESPFAKAEFVQTNKRPDYAEKETDTDEFKEFIKTVPLTGDPEVDEEIYSFYREKFNCEIKS